ncbi:MAG TPA: glycosyltransferase family 39 protein [Candidatus Eisenbacteria bacterium]|jgi:hypothetical protein|nr:glycosyltransferase family 39 protein [Candidatus Eisenbacteria bacterium]
MFTAGLSRTEKGLLAAIALLVSCAFFVARRIDVDYYDCYDLYGNARALLAGDRGLYYGVRPALGSVLLVPFLVLQDRLFGGNFAFRSTHLAVPAFYAGTLLFFYKMLRVSVRREEALWAVALLAANPLMIRMSVSVKEDLPGLFFTAAAFYYLAILERDGKTRSRIGACLGAAAAVSLRYFLLPLFAGAHLAAAAVRAAWGRRSAANRVLDLVWIVALPLALFAAVPILVNWIGFKASGPAHAAGMFVDDLRSIRNEHWPAEPASQNLSFLVKACTAPGMALFLFGLFTRFRDREDGAPIFFAWLLVAAIILNYGVPHKEARYLLPLLPPFYYFAAGGFAGILRGVSSRFGKSAVPAGVAAFVLLALPAAAAAETAGIFQEPLYRQGFHRPASLYAAALAGEGQIHWYGNLYPVHPRNYLFHPKDDTAFIYHFFTQAVRFYTGRDVRLVRDESSLSKLRKGDVLILNPDPVFYDSSNVPASPKPLSIGKVKSVTLMPPAFATINGYHWIESDGYDSDLDIFVIRGDGKIPNGEVVSRSPRMTARFEAGRFEGNADVKVVVVVAYAERRFFSNPGDRKA